MKPQLPERPQSTQPTERQLASFDILGWFASNRDKLKPPTGAITLLGDRDYMISLVGGPNWRPDFHVNPHEEFYFQLECTLRLRIQHEGKPVDVMVPPGSLLLARARRAARSTGAGRQRGSYSRADSRIS